MEENNVIDTLPQEAKPADESCKCTQKPPKADKRVPMLFMCFLIFVCVAIFPLVKLELVGTLNISGYDVAKFAGFFADLTDVEDRDIVNFVEGIVAPEDGQEDELTTAVVNYAEEVIAPGITEWTEPLNIMFNVVAFFCYAVLVIFFVMLIAALFNRRILYLVCNILVLLILIGILSLIGLKYLGYGAIVALLLLLVNCFLPFIKKRVKKD